MKKIRHFLSYIILRVTSSILILLPLGFSYFLARVIGNFAFHVLRFRRQIAIENLEIAFGREMSHAQLEALASRAYGQIAMTFMELMIAPKLHAQIQNILEPEHIALMQKLLHEGKGLVMVSGHLGNWELQGAAAATAMTEPPIVAAMQQSNRYVDRFITRRRNKLGMRVINKKRAMRHLLKALQRGQAVGLVADQKAGSNAVFVDFFDKVAATQPGPAQLALKFKAPLLIGAAIRVGPAQFKMLCQQVEIKEDDTVETLTQRHVKILESFIRQYPEQYFWLHRRWKIRQ